MFSLTAANVCITKSRCRSLSRLSGPLLASSLIVGGNPEGKGDIRGKNGGFSGRSLGFDGSRKNLGGNWCCRCERGGGEEGDVELEEEIMKFMAESEKPTMFPTKKELIGAGRVDLVEAIEERGGWYALGWGGDDVKGHVEEAVEIDVGEFQSDAEAFNCRKKNSHTLKKQLRVRLGFSAVECFSIAGKTYRGVVWFREMGAEEDSGIEGILSRLERQRNSDLGFDFGRNEHYVRAGSKDNIASTDLEGNGGLAPNLNQSGTLNTSGSYITQNSEPETWRSWSNQRAGFQHTDFEAAEISFSKEPSESDEENNCDGISITTIECAEDWCNYAQISHSQIRSRLQQLESEFATALYSLRSKRVEHISEEVCASSSCSQDLSDTWEFQENELMSAKERLRSIRAKLAVLEEKMALAIIDAQKIIQMKQKRIDGARKAFKLFRTTCIVWHNSASEVLLAGSFDGWTSQRKMERSRMGIFSTCLKLYPGRYEIKFIVDGKWKVDPLRPIVKNNGRENNLLVVT